MSACHIPSEDSAFHGWMEQVEKQIIHLLSHYDMQAEYCPQNTSTDFFLA